MIMAAIQKNILEHISIMAQEQVQLEFREQIHAITVIQQQAPTIHKLQQMLQVMTQ